MQFRRCVNAAFAMSALVQYEPFVDNTTKLFLKQTENLYINGGGDTNSTAAGNKDQWSVRSVACDFTRWLQFYAFDVIGEITYSKRHGFIEKNEDIDGIVAYLTKLFLYVAPVSFNPTFSQVLLTGGSVKITDVFLGYRLSYSQRTGYIDRPNSHPRPPLSQEPHLPQAVAMGL